MVTWNTNHSYDYLKLVVTLTPLDQIYIQREFAIINLIKITLVNHYLRNNSDVFKYVQIGTIHTSLKDILRHILSLYCIFNMDLSNMCNIAHVKQLKVKKNRKIYF